MHPSLHHQAAVIPTLLTMKSVVTSPSRTEEEAYSIFDCFKAMTITISICMLLEFMSKFTLELLSAAISITTMKLYGWGIERGGKARFNFDQTGFS